ncbi:hypothetical protein N8865_00420 [Francisellaceae bacterium]|nr:hypothetical protein [Francisellaceae bacterium]
MHAASWGYPKPVGVVDARNGDLQLDVPLTGFNVPNFGSYSLTMHYNPHITDKDSPNYIAKSWGYNLPYLKGHILHMGGGVRYVLGDLTAKPFNLVLTSGNKDNSTSLALKPRASILYGFAKNLYIEPTGIKVKEGEKVFSGGKDSHPLFNSLEIYTPSGQDITLMAVPNSTGADKIYRVSQIHYSNGYTVYFAYGVSGSLKGHLIKISDNAGNSSSVTRTTTPASGTMLSWSQYIGDKDQQSKVNVNINSSGELANVQTQPASGSASSGDLTTSFTYFTTTGAQDKSEKITTDDKLTLLSSVTNPMGSKIDYNYAWVKEIRVHDVSTNRIPAKEVLIRAHPSIYQTCEYSAQDNKVYQSTVYNFGGATAGTSIFKKLATNDKFSTLNKDFETISPDCSGVTSASVTDKFTFFHPSFLGWPLSRTADGSTPYYPSSKVDLNLWGQKLTIEAFNDVPGHKNNYYWTAVHNYNSLYPKAGSTAVSVFNMNHQLVNSLSMNSFALNGDSKKAYNQFSMSVYSYNDGDEYDFGSLDIKPSADGRVLWQIRQNLDLQPKKALANPNIRAREQVSRSFTLPETHTNKVMLWKETMPNKKTGTGAIPTLSGSDITMAYNEEHMPTNIKRCDLYDNCSEEITSYADSLNSEYIKGVSFLPERIATIKSISGLGKTGQSTQTFDYKRMSLGTSSPQGHIGVTGGARYFDAAQEGRSPHFFGSITNVSEVPKHLLKTAYSATGAAYKVSSYKNTWSLAEISSAIKVPYVSTVSAMGSQQNYTLSKGSGILTDKDEQLKAPLHSSVETVKSLSFDLPNHQETVRSHVNTGLAKEASQQVDLYNIKSGKLINSEDYHGLKVKAVIHSGVKGSGANISLSTKYSYDGYGDIANTVVKGLSFGSEEVTPVFSNKSVVVTRPILAGKVRYIQTISTNNLTGSSVKSVSSPLFEKEYQPKIKIGLHNTDGSIKKAITWVKTAETRYNPMGQPIKTRSFHQSLGLYDDKGHTTVDYFYTSGYGGLSYTQNTSTKNKTYTFTTLPFASGDELQSISMSYQVNDALDSSFVGPVSLESVWTKNGVLNKKSTYLLSGKDVDADAACKNAVTSTCLQKLVKNHSARFISTYNQAGMKISEETINPAYVKPNSISIPEEIKSASSGQMYITKNIYYNALAQVRRVELPGFNSGSTTNKVAHINRYSGYNADGSLNCLAQSFPEAENSNGVNYCNATTAQYDSSGRSSLLGAKQFNRFGMLTYQYNGVGQKKSFEYDSELNLTKSSVMLTKVEPEKTLYITKDNVGVVYDSAVPVLRSLTSNGVKEFMKTIFGSGVTQAQINDAPKYFIGVNKIIPTFYPNGRLESKTFTNGAGMTFTKTLTYYQGGDVHKETWNRKKGNTLIGAHSVEYQQRDYITGLSIEKQVSMSVSKTNALGVNTLATKTYKSVLKKHTPFESEVIKSDVTQVDGKPSWKWDITKKYSKYTGQELLNKTIYTDNSKGLDKESTMSSGANNTYNDMGQLSVVKQNMWHKDVKKTSGGGDLKDERTTSYTYNLAGNIISKTYTIPSALGPISNPWEVSTYYAYTEHNQLHGMYNKTGNDNVADSVNHFPRNQLGTPIKYRLYHYGINDNLARVDTVVTVPGASGQEQGYSRNYHYPTQAEVKSGIALPDELSRISFDNQTGKDDYVSLGLYKKRYGGSHHYNYFPNGLPFYDSKGDIYFYNVRGQVRQVVQRYIPAEGQVWGKDLGNTFYNYGLDGLLSSQDSTLYGDDSSGSILKVQGNNKTVNYFYSNGALSAETQANGSALPVLKRFMGNGLSLVDTPTSAGVYGNVVSTFNVVSQRTGSVQASVTMGVDNGHHYTYYAYTPFGYQSKVGDMAKASTNSSTIWGNTQYGMKPLDILKNNMGYDGVQSDPSTGKTMFGDWGRLYSPEIGRFDNPDTFNAFDGINNLYSFTDNNPINANDLSGHMSEADRDQEYSAAIYGTMFGAMGLALATNPLGWALGAGMMIAAGMHAYSAYADNKVMGQAATMTDLFTSGAGMANDTESVMNASRGSRKFGMLENAAGRVSDGEGTKAIERELETSDFDGAFISKVESLMEKKMDNFNSRADKLGVERALIIEKLRSSRSFNNVPFDLIREIAEFTPVPGEISMRIKSGGGYASFKFKIPRHIGEIEELNKYEPLGVRNSAVIEKEIEDVGKEYYTHVVSRSSKPQTLPLVDVDVELLNSLNGSEFVITGLQKLEYFGFMKLQFTLADHGWLQLLALPIGQDARMTTSKVRMNFNASGLSFLPY